MYIETARSVVYAYVRDHLDKTDEVPFGPDDVFVVWFCKTLDKAKALLSTQLFDGMYYEVTFDLPAQKIYLDAYKKFENQALELEQWSTTSFG